MQEIDVSSAASEVDEGNVLCDLSASLGGFADQDDNATFNVTFLRPGRVLGSSTLGPVTVVDREGLTRLLSRATTVAVPPQTRTIRVVLTMTSTAPFNDGYADSLSVKLRLASPLPTATPTATATPTHSPTATATQTASPTATAIPTASPSATATPGGSTLANISTRLPVQTGDNALIGGFIITGTQPKKVIIRAIGPSLSLPGKLANPVLQLFSGSTLLESNDNWVDSPNKQAIIDSTIPPTNDLESAIVRTLPANAATYTAIVRGVNNTTGIGVVEAYDLDRTTDSKLANISTRGLVQSGDNVLIAGTIILGSQSQKVIVRAIGPSLPFAGTLANPTLELRDQNGGVLEANDNWVDSPNKQAIIDSTIPPTNDLESAIVRTLPGNGASYTAIVRGVNNTSGIAVVEVYSLQ